MVQINSKHATVSRSPEALYMSFVDMRNFLNYLPEDKKKGITADCDTISASVQGFNIGVKIVERVPYSRITFKDNGAPFSFSVNLIFAAVESCPDKTDFYIEAEADLNFMMKMMLESKIKEGLDKLVDGVASVSEGRMPEGL